MLFALKKLGLRDIYFSYKKPSEKLDLSLKLDTMQLDKASLDLAKQSLTAQNISLSNSAINAFVWMPAENPSNEKEAIEQPVAENNWKIAIDKINLGNNSFIYHNAAMPAAKGFDYNHVEAKHINFFSKENRSDENGFYTDIDSCSFVVNDRFFLKGLRTSVAYTNSLLLIKDFAFAFNQSHLNTTGELAWELKPGSFSSNKNLRCRVENSVISYDDLLQLQPSLAKTLPIALPPSGKLVISGNLTGTLQNLSMKELKLHTGNKDFQFAGNAEIRNGIGKDGLTL